MSKRTGLTDILGNVYQNGFMEALKAMAVDKRTFYDKELWSYLVNEKHYLDKQRAGHVPLYWALQRTDFSLVTLRFLIRMGANKSDPDARIAVDEVIDPSTGDTILMHASRNNESDKVEALLDLDADFEVKNIYGWTALIWASCKGCVECVKLLIEAGANVNTTNLVGRTALIWASEEGHADVVKVLLEAGADVNATECNGWSALIWASHNGHKQCCRLLVQAGADRADIEIDNAVVDCIVWSVYSLIICICPARFLCQ